jgi:hypothetical protein
MREAENGNYGALLSTKHLDSSLNPRLERLEPLLLLPTLFVGARRTPEAELRRGRLSGLEVRSRDVGDGADKVRGVVERFRALDASHTELQGDVDEHAKKRKREQTKKERKERKERKAMHLPRLLEVLKVQLEQRLNVIAGESNRHQQQIVLALLCVSLDRVARLRTQPRRRSNLALPYQSVRVAETESVHDGGHGSADFGGVGVAAINDGHGEGVGGEEKGDLVAGFGRIGE